MINFDKLQRTYVWQEDAVVISIGTLLPFLYKIKNLLLSKFQGQETIESTKT